MIRSALLPVIVRRSAWLSLLLLASGCDSVPNVPPNPFRTTPTIVVEVTPTPAPPTVEPTLTPEPFVAYWVKNFRQAEMWSGPTGQPGVISFGTTSSQFCAFKVLRPQEGPRLYVLNPYSGGNFWIDADAVGPVEVAPIRALGPKPADENCADRLYDP